MIDKDQLNEALSQSAIVGDIDSIRELIESGADPRHKESEALTFAIRRGHTECALFLLPLSNPKDNLGESFGLTMACLKKGHPLAKALFDSVKDDENIMVERLRQTINAGDTENSLCIVRHISNPGRVSEAMEGCIRWGHHETFDALLPYADPKHDDSRMLVIAAEVDDPYFVGRLWGISDTDAALRLSEGHATNLGTRSHSVLRSLKERESLLLSHEAGSMKPTHQGL